MAEDDAESPSKVATDSTAAIPLVNREARAARTADAPILLLAPSDPELPAPESTRSVDELLGDVDEPPRSEDNEPVALNRSAMHRSAHPPPLPPKAAATRGRSRTMPPPLPPPLPPVTAPSPRPGAAAPRLPPLPATALPPPPAAPRPRPPTMPPPLPRSVTRGPELELLNARIASLETERDTFGLGRALAELAVAHELAEDDTLAIDAAESALAKDPTLFAMHGVLRRKLHSRTNVSSLLGHVEAELAHASEGALRTGLLAERARLLGALGRGSDALAAWSLVLQNDPRNAAALRGKEVAIANQPGDGPDRWLAEADHLASMAEAYADDRETAAWLLVERAEILESRLADAASARHALERALTLSPGVGPARRALVRHVSRAHDPVALVRLLDEEGRLETDNARAARLELEAATIAEGALLDLALAASLLERAARRGPTSRSVDLRVLGDLSRVLEALGRGADAARWRRSSLPLLASKGARAEALRSLATAAERAGALDAAIADLEASLVDEPDASTVAHVDRLLEAAGRHEPRIALWVTDAARAAEPEHRVASLLAAARVAERALGRHDEAVRHLRTAWTTQPGHAEVLEGLTRLLARKSEDEAARARMELYAHAASVAAEPTRKVAYLERVALLAEESLGDFARAAATYEAVLALDPGRVGALMGLARSAARVGDDRGVHGALLAQAKASSSDAGALDLKVRAAAAVARVDPELAVATLTEVLDASPENAAARSLLTHLHEADGRWELVASALESRIDHAKPDERRSLLLRLAEVQQSRLKQSTDALATLYRARSEWPGDPRVLGAIARALEAVGDASLLRDAYESLASTATTDGERADYLVRSAELSEHRLGDDVAATRAYDEAERASPGDPVVAERLERLRARDASGLPTEALDRALALVLGGRGDLDAHAALTTVLLEGRDVIPALRLLERLYRRDEAWGSLATALAQQADAHKAPRPRLGALWALADVEEWRVEETPGHRTYAQILALDPGDTEALGAVVRTRLAAALHGDEPARVATLEALRQRATLESGSGRVVTELLLAHLLESGDSSNDPAHAEEALGRYRRVLSVNATSVTAAWGLRRLAHRLGRTADEVQASTTLAELTLDPKARARHYVDAADLVASADEAGAAGESVARKERAATLLERALVANPDGISAATALVATRTALEQPDALLLTLRTTLDQARTRDAIVFLGTEVARLAREHLHDLVVATRAMERVRDIAPSHAQSLLTLAELYLAQRAWPEAVATLESVVRHGDDPEPRMTALFALGSIYEKVLARPQDLERVLRAALEIEPASPRALRGLIDLLRGRRAAGGKREPGPSDSPGDAADVGSLLQRLARAEPDPTKQCEAFLDAADLEVEAGDMAGAERSIVEAIVRCPSNARAFARLAAFFRGKNGLDASGYARALQGLISRGRDAGLADARWFAALGQLEIDTLQRLHEGVAHLEWAVQLDPSLYETRFELADAYEKTGARDLAIRGLLGLISPDAHALAALADPGVALALLERTLEQAKRAEDAVVVSELRAMLGEVDPGRADWLRARRLSPLGDHHTPLGRAALVEEVLPRGGRHVLLEVAVAGTGLEAKVLRTNLSDLGLNPRDRIGPRSGSPLRGPFERVTAALGCGDIELAVSPVVDRVRVAIQDAPWVVLPSTFEALPEPVQVASLARACAQILLGVPWRKELRETAILGYLVAVARQVVPAYGDAERDSTLEALGTFEPQVARAIGRKQRKLLEGLVPHLTQREGQPPERQAFLLALDQCAARAAYLVSGDLVATARALAEEDAHLKEAIAIPGQTALNALLDHAIAGDVARFALTPEATTLRHRLGSSWAR